MSLRTSYTLLAPVYDSVVARFSRPYRQLSIDALDLQAQQHILLAGIGTGLDIPHLPNGPAYTGIDLTEAMLRRAHRQCRQRNDMRLHCGDVRQLPYRDNQFDAVLLHLIVAIVPQPEYLLHEVVRVLKTGGHVHIIDKFLRADERAVLRQWLNPLASRIASHTNVRIEPLLQQTPQLSLLEDRPLAFNGWFRFLRLQKTL